MNQEKLGIFHPQQDTTSQLVMRGILKVQGPLTESAQTIEDFVTTNRDDVGTELTLFEGGRTTYELTIPTHTAIPDEVGIVLLLQGDEN